MTAQVPVAVRARDVLISEWTKLRSLRSTYWTLLVAVATPIGLSALVAVTLANAPGHGPPVDPLLPGLLSLEYAVLAVGVLGVMTFSAEFSTGLVRTTFTAVPRRRAVLAAKAAVLGAVTLAAGEVVAFASFGLVQAVLSGQHLGVSLSRPGVPGAGLVPAGPAGLARRRPADRRTADHPPRHLNPQNPAARATARSA